MSDPSTLDTPSKVQEALSHLHRQLEPSLQHPKIAIVCGSGLGNLADVVQDKPRAEFEYSSIPHFPRTTVSGHAGKLVFGYLSGAAVVLMVGRTQLVAKR